MLLTLDLGILNQSGNDCEIRFPCDITPWLGLDKEHPSLFAYGDISPNQEQIFISPFPLSNKIFILTAILKNRKASCEKVLSYLRDKNISILRTDVQSMQHSAYWEAIISINQQTDPKIIKGFEDEIKHNCDTVIDIWIRSIMNKLPKNDIHNCIINFNLYKDITLSSYGSGPSILKISRTDLKKLLHNTEFQEKKAILGLYPQIPLMVIHFFKMEAKLVYFSYELEDEIGAFYNTIKPITDVCSIIGLNATSTSMRPSREYGICSGIFCIDKDKDFYDLTEVLDNMDRNIFKLKRDPLKLYWSPTDYATYLYLIKKIFDATWENQDIGKPNKDLDQNCFGRAIHLGGFKTPNTHNQNLDVVFTLRKEKRKKGSFDFTVTVRGTYQENSSENDLDECEKILNQNLQNKKSEISSRLNNDVDWEKIY